MFSMRPAALLLVAAALAPSPQQSDAKGAKDHPLLKRYEGSRIVLHSETAYGSYVLPLGPSNGAYVNTALRKSQPIEGRITRLTYLVPSGRSPLEVVRNYEAELKAAGWRVLFQGSGAALGNAPAKGAFAKAAYPRMVLGSSSVATFDYISRDADTDDVFLAGKLPRPEGDVHVAVYAVRISPQAISHLGLSRITSAGEVLVQVDIVESKPMETKMVTVDAAEMGKAIAATGSVALYGIYFDTNRAELTPASNAALAEIAKLLHGQPQLKLLVVGHTDNVGSFQSNLELSQRRAAAVVKALAGTHGIDGRRLTPVGVSFASPVASNRTEEGRAKNRRVQLVEQ